MQIKRFAATAFAAFTLLAGCSAQESYQKITAEEARNKIEKGGVTIVDVRTAEEYQEKHLDGAILIPLDTIGDTAPEALPDQEAELIVYCRTGVRSKAASDKLVELGYQHVSDMGGITDWPYETVTGEASAE